MSTITPNYNLAKPEMTDPTEDFLTDFGTNMDIIDQNLGGGGGSSTLAGLSDVNLTSPITDDALIYDGAEWVNSHLSAVAFSGDYSDLLNAPTIPTKTSDLNNDSDFVSDASYVHTDNNFTNADVTKLSGIQAGAEVNVQSDWNEADNTADDYIKNKPTIPTNTSDLNNDSGFLDSSDITVTQVQTTGTKIATIDVDGNSTDLYAPTGGGGNKHTILNESGTALADEPNLQFTDGLKASDDSGNNKTKVGVNTTFTEASTRANIASGDTFSTILGKIKKFFTDLKAVAFSGSYNDLSDKPTIPDISTKVSKSGDNMTGSLTMKGKDVILGTTGSGSNDSGDLIYLYGNGNEKMRIWAEDAYNDGVGPIYRVYKSDGTLLYMGRLATLAEVDGRVAKSGDTMTGTLTTPRVVATQDGVYAGVVVGSNSEAGRVTFKHGNSTNTSTNLAVENGLTSELDINLPSRSGTLALTSDLGNMINDANHKKERTGAGSITFNSSLKGHLAFVWIQAQSNNYWWLGGNAIILGSHPFAYMFVTGAGIDAYISLGFGTNPDVTLQWVNQDGNDVTSTSKMVVWVM